MRNNFIRSVIGSVCVWLCVGCASTVQQRQFYTLHSIENVADVKAVTISGGLGVGPIELPEFLSGNNVVSLLGNQQIQKSQVHLWAGDLQRTVSRTLAANLSLQLGFDEIWPFPWDTRNRPEKQISILIEKMDGQLGKPVTLIVKWTMLDERGQHLVSVGRQQYTATPSDSSYGNYVGAINDVINQFSKTLEAQIRQRWSGEK